MRWPSPASEAMVSLPMMESSATVNPMRIPVRMIGSAAGFTGPEDRPEIAQHRDRIGEKQRTHPPAGRGEIPQRDERDQERGLNRAAGEAPLAFLAGRCHGAPSRAALTDVSATVLRISSCSRA